MSVGAKAKFTYNLNKDIGITNGCDCIIRGFYYDESREMVGMLDYDKIKYVIVEVPSLNEGE